MALKLSLKPGEKVVVNGAVLQNDDRRTSIVVQNHASILREKDIMLPEQAATPARRIYFAIMMLYLQEGDSERYREEFVQRMSEFINVLSTPEAITTCFSIVEHVHMGAFYKALSQCRSLFPFEEERLSHVPSAA